MMAPIHSHITSGETSTRNVEAHGCDTNRWATSLMKMSRNWKIVLSCEARWAAGARSAARMRAAELRVTLAHQALEAAQVRRDHHPQVAQRP